MNPVQILQGARQEAVNNIATIVINTVKAKAFYKVGGWELVNAELGNSALNHNFGMSNIALGMKLRELGMKTDYIIKNLLSDVVKVVNKEFGCNAVRYDVDRRNYAIYINL
jgi:hypothetical protein